MGLARRLTAAMALAAVAASLVPGGRPAGAAGAGGCEDLERGRRTAGVSDAAPGPGPLRMFAIQFRQEVSYVESYGVFERKLGCLMRAYVEPHLAPADPAAAGKVGMVVFNEDIGLATLATGSRGAPARALASLPVPGNTPALYAQTRLPQGAAAAFGLVAAGYARQLAAYRARFPEEDPRKAVITAATDTFVRGFMSAFSRLARRWGVYVVASNNQGDFHYSTDPADVAAFADPDLAADYATGQIRGVWVADAPLAWNEAFLWAPRDVRPPEAGASADPSSAEYDPRTNLVFTNRKGPLTQIEMDFLALDAGDSSPANTGPVELPDLPGFRFGFAISLPAFVYGYAQGEAPPPGDPCSSTARWMLCLDRRGVNTVIQPEANPQPWAHDNGSGWEALTWGASTLRAVTDPTVGFRYVICPHLVGNLVDLPFDGQTAIVARGRTGAGRHYIGAGTFLDGVDPQWALPYAGEHPEFLALAPWVLQESGDPRADRARLGAESEALMAGSLSPESNGYLETAIFADLATP